MDSDRTTMMGGPGANFASEEQCPACEASIPGGDEFCPKCGYQRGTWVADGAVAAASTNGAAPAAPAATSGPALWTVSADDQSWPLNAGTYVIGRGEVDITIDDSFASRRHAQLEVTAGSVTLTDVGSSNGTFVGERRLEANASEQLADGTTFKVANTELTLAKSQAAADATTIAAPQEMAKPEGTQIMDPEHEGAQQTDSEGTTIDAQAQLPEDQEVQEPAIPSASHWELHREGGETIPLGFGECTLGRKEPASCVVEGDSYISGVHARLIATEDRLEITDLGSTNGTFVNEARLDPQQPWKLTSGDKLRLGQTTFVVENNRPTVSVGQEQEQMEEL
jgi:pSer/pThr/pTyr-binding forkhead associated (FHA) protein